MPEESFEEKTEEASPKRKREARERGNVAKSTEINSVLVLLLGVLSLKLMAHWSYGELVAAFRSIFDMFDAVEDISISDVVLLFNTYVFLFFKIAMPVALIILFSGVVANILQIGFLLTFEPLTPKLEKINPISGFQRLFSLRSFVEAAKSIAKMSVIAIVAYMTIKGIFPRLLELQNTSVAYFWFFILQVGFKIVIRVALVLAVIAIFDFAYQRYEQNKKLRMTKQEVKEEHKEMEGDPQVKSRIRSLQREMARRRMMEEVPKATVVVTNPTHLAIAIRYEASEMETPVIVAKGKLHLAERIKEIAKETDIPIVEDKPLARAMFDKVEPGDEIPAEFFNAVAEILAYVYRLKSGVA